MKVSDGYLVQGRIRRRQSRVTEFAEALQQVSDALRHADWPKGRGVYVTDDWIYPRPDKAPALVVYFSPAAAEMFEALVLTLGGEPCTKPLPFGLVAYGGAKIEDLD